VVPLPSGTIVYPPANATSVELPDLDRGTAYTFHVWAVNAAGIGPVATTATITTPPGRLVVAGDLEWVRRETNGAPGWTDAMLTTLATDWTVRPRALALGMPPPPCPVAGCELDLWATVAMVFEVRLLAALEDPRTGAVMVRTGDLHVQYADGGGSTSFLRSRIKRAWSRADPENREVGHPTGWRTVEVGVAHRYALRYPAFLPRSLVVNGQAGEPFDGFTPGQILNDPEAP
jgi:hypothetical protein